MSVSLPKKVSSHGISLVATFKEVIGSPMGTSCFFFGLGFRRGFYKINNIYIKLDVIHKYKLI